MATAIYRVLPGHDPSDSASAARKYSEAADRAARMCAEWVEERRRDGLRIDDEEITAMRRGSAPRSSSHQYISMWRDHVAAAEAARAAQAAAKRPPRAPTIEIVVTESYDIRVALRAAGYRYSASAMSRDLLGLSRVAGWVKSGITPAEAMQEHRILMDLGCEEQIEPQATTLLRSVFDGRPELVGL
jgi:hypothetical protein